MNDDEQEKMTKEIRQRLENSDLNEILERIDYLLNEENEIKPHMLGLKMALILVDELKNKEPLGARSGKLILEYKDQMSAEGLEEAIAYARQFITKPEELSKLLAEKLFGENS